MIGPGILAILLISLAGTLPPYLASAALFRSDERLAVSPVLDESVLRREGRRMLPLWLLFGLLPAALFLLTIVLAVLALHFKTFTFWHLVFVLAAFTFFAVTIYCARLMLGRVRLALLLARGKPLHISVDQLVCKKKDERGSGRTYRVSFFLYFQGPNHCDEERVCDNRIFDHYCQGRSFYRFRDGAERVLLTLDAQDLPLSDSLARLLED